MRRTAPGKARSGRRFLVTNGATFWLWSCLHKPGAPMVKEMKLKEEHSDSFRTKTLKGLVAFSFVLGRLQPRL